MILLSTRSIGFQVCFVLGFVIPLSTSTQAQPPPQTPPGPAPATAALLRQVDAALDRRPLLQVDPTAAEDLAREIAAALAQVAPRLPELPLAVGQPPRFVPLTLNAGRTGFDAVRVRLPTIGKQYRLILDTVVAGATEADSSLADHGLWLVDEARWLGHRSRQAGPIQAPGAGLPPAHQHDIVQLGPYERLNVGAEVLIWFDFKSDAPTPVWLRLQVDPVQPPDPPSTPALQAARTTFQTGLGQLSDRHDAEVKALRRLYLAELDKVAQLPATKRDPAELGRITAEVDRVNGGDASAESPRGLRILRAEYGSQNRWMDVTVPLRALIRGNTLVYDPGDQSKNGFKPDPDFQAPKTLIIIYTTDGVPGFSMTNDTRRVEIPRRSGRK